MAVRYTEEWRSKISEGMRKHFEANPERKKKAAEHFKRAQQAHPEAFSKGRQAGYQKAEPNLHAAPESILELSPRTVRKILKRLQVGCSRCGWSEGTSDLHHIHGRKGANAHRHENLTLLCPNCHRLVHERKIGSEGLVSFMVQIGDRWKLYYFKNQGTYK